MLGSLNKLAPGQHPRCCVLINVCQIWKTGIRDESWIEIQRGRTREQEGLQRTERTAESNIEDKIREGDGTRAEEMKKRRVKYMEGSSEGKRGDGREGGKRANPRVNKHREGEGDVPLSQQSSRSLVELWTWPPLEAWWQFEVNGWNELEHFRC